MGKNKKVVGFKDDEIYIKESDVDAIRRRPSMWISSVGLEGVFHLCKEIIDNNKDECLKKESPADTITVVIDKKQLVSRDNGRGIATGLLREVFETTQAGSNMTRSGGATSGENGVGTTCVLAMSSELVVTSIRPVEKKKLTLVYREAELVDEKLEPYDGDDHGLIVSFKPSKKVLGVDEIPIDELRNWIRDFNYTLPANVKMKYTIENESYEVTHRPLDHYLTSIIDTEQMLTMPVTFKCSGGLVETILGKEYNRTFEIEFVLSYSDPDKYKQNEDIRQSWMNTINTIDNGSHVDGVISGYTKYITEQVQKKNKKLVDANLQKDVLAHLNVVVRGMCTCATMFSSQSKHKVFLRSLGNAIAKAVYEKLERDSNGMGNFVDVVIGNHRARIAGEQARNVSSIVKTKKQWTIPDSFIPESSVKCNHPKELFMVEGNSAGGGLRGARDATYQAIIFFKGKPLNAYNIDPVKVLVSDSWKHIIPTIGCGIPCDIKKMRYERIIICTDADIDGNHIRTLMCTFFLRLAPEIIRAGRLYIAEPPLYKLQRGKDVKYVATQVEYINECINSVSDFKISFNDGKPVDVKAFITDAFDYLTTLKECSVNRVVNGYLLEHIAMGFVQYKTPQNFINNIDKWLKSMAKFYREIGFDHNTNQITATIDLIDQFVLIDDELMVELENVIRIQSKYGVIINYESEKRNIKRSTELSQFFEYVEASYPQIKGRYKGLGTSDPDVLREVVTDPRTRRLYQVTIEDAMTMEKMAALVGNGKENINQRKEMLMEFKFTKADIDS